MSRTISSGSVEKKSNSAAAGNRSPYVLRLYVAGTTLRSVRAIENIKRICETHLKGRYRLKVVDIYQQPQLAAKERLVVAPTLVKRLPKPLRRFIGDLSQTEKLLAGMDLAWDKETDRPRKR